MPVGNETNHSLNGATIRGGLAISDMVGTNTAYLASDSTGNLLVNGSVVGSTPSSVGTRAFWIGDSITASGYIAANLWQANLSLSAWTCFLSGGSIELIGQGATGGFTTANVLATHVPQAIASGADVCFILAGTNDARALVSVATAAANLASMYTQIKAAGIIPVACTIPPAADGTQAARSRAIAINAWIRRAANYYHIPLVDYYAAVVDPANGNFLSGYSADSLHPLQPGAQAMGQAAVTALSNVFYEARTPPLSMENADLNNLFSVANSVQLTDTNSDGIPDDWSVSSTDGTQVPSLVTGDTAIKGNWFKVSKTAGTGFSSYTKSTGAAVTAGDRLLVMARVKLVSTSGGYAELRVLDGTSNALMTVTGSAVNLWDVRGVSTGVMMLPIITVPAGTTLVKLQFSVRSGVCDAQIAQPTILNLTTLGITI